MPNWHVWLYQQRGHNIGESPDMLVLQTATPCNIANVNVPSAQMYKWNGSWKEKEKQPRLALLFAQIKTSKRKVWKSMFGRTSHFWGSCRSVNKKKWTLVFLFYIKAQKENFAPISTSCKYSIYKFWPKRLLKRSDASSSAAGKDPSSSHLSVVDLELESKNKNIVTHKKPKC